jgi:hypothetical protein
MIRENRSPPVLRSSAERGRRVDSGHFMADPHALRALAGRFSVAAEELSRPIDALADEARPPGGALAPLAGRGHEWGDRHDAQRRYDELLDRTLTALGQVRGALESEAHRLADGSAAYSNCDHVQRREIEAVGELLRHGSANRRDHSG